MRMCKAKDFGHLSWPLQRSWPLGELVTSHALGTAIGLYWPDRREAALDVVTIVRMLTCASCGVENQDEARFCMSCAAPLTIPVERREERKVVSVLFADLVGFTSRSEQLDVEEVRGTLEPYQARLRQELERFGGTVEKFIGDAVMAVFGAPVAREDDAERAVRAALAIRDSVGELGQDLEVRVGVQTGEALVAVGVRPELGEGIVSGDVVNTAARLQGLAPVGEVLVGEATFRATERVVVYEPHEPVVAKGKAEPVACWVAREPRSRVPAAVRDSMPLVGRERERRLLLDALERCRAERSVQLVTIVGVPGIGKSRLVEELRAEVEAAPEPTTWRVGRVLSYGEGVAFWPVAEIIKQQAGILESDDAATTAGKLDAAIEAVGLAGADAVWARRQLAPLMGVETSADTGGLEETFAGWRLFLEALAAGGTVVLVVEDLHWAEDALLDFLDALIDRITSVPLLVVCTARPELWEKRASWGGGKPNALTISLGPLSEAETRELVGALADPSLLVDAAKDELLGRAGGNPLYAQEYVRMVVERGADASALPESVQGIIAARLDALSAEEKSLLQDAAVVGRTSWLGAVCVLGERERAAAEGLAFRLERKQLLRRTRQSSVAGEIELSFAHDLIQEVAYAQLTRPQRAQRHERAAAWVGQLAGDRDDRAELVAHHLSTGLALRDALGEDATALRERTLRALVAAAHHAASRHDSTATIALVEKALALHPDADTRAELLVRRALAHSRLGTATETLLADARDAALDAGHAEDAVQAAHLLTSWALHQAADGALSDRYNAQALELALAQPPGPVTGLPAAFHAFRLEIQGRFAEEIAFTERELTRARASGSEEAVALLLERHGAARIGSGDAAGLDDVHAAYRILDRHANANAAVSASNLGEGLLLFGRLEEARTAYGEGLVWSRRIGNRQSELYTLAGLAGVAYHTGETVLAASLMDAAEAVGKNEFATAWLLIWRGRLALAEDLDRAVADAERALAYADKTQNDEIRVEAYALLARAHQAACRRDAARAACDAFLDRWRALPIQTLALVEAGLALAAQSRHAELADAAALALPSPWTDAARALADRRYEQAAAVLDSIPSIPFRDAARELIRGPTGET
jgi:class 3 adenylate cyclase